VIFQKFVVEFNVNNNIEVFMQNVMKFTGIIVLLMLIPYASYAEKVLCGTPSECYQDAMKKLQEARSKIEKQQQENKRLVERIKTMSSNFTKENKRLVNEINTLISNVISASSDGKVGIGTKSPSHKLMIKSSDEKTLRLIGPGKRGSKGKLNFGDGDYAFIHEYEDDKLEIKANKLKLSTKIEGEKASFKGNVYVGGYDKVTGNNNALNVKATSDYAAVYVEQKGKGDALWIEHKGSEESALGMRANNDDSTLWIKQKGTGNAASFYAKAGHALYLESNSNDYATLWLKQNGTSNAANFKAKAGHALLLESNSNDYATLYVEQNGSGKAAYLKGTMAASGSKNFQIPHPTKQDFDLVHASVEGPEVAVFYRGETQLTNGHVIIKLPDYFEALTRKERRTVQLTPKGNEPYLLSYTDIVEGVFHVYGTKQDGFFSWEVKAIRADIPALKVEVPTDK
jgi:hypothetical protein